MTLIVTASCQIHTKLEADGYHYDRPQNRLNVPEAVTEKALPVKPQTAPPLPAFIPRINLPSVIPVKPTEAPVTQRALPVNPQTPPPLPAFIPRINLPSVIPVKPTNSPQIKRPIPPFPPIINLPSIIPVKPTQAPTTRAPVAPIVEVSKPAPFAPRSQATNEYLPPVEAEQEDEWEAWKVCMEAWNVNIKSISCLGADKI